jgi:DNA-binding IclR family transcriptional regulator
VLENLAGHRDGLSLGDLARRLSMSKSGTHGVLSILVRRGFVERLPGGIYRLGLKAWQVGNDMREADLARIAQPIMERLVQETGEGAIVGVLRGFDVVYLTRVGGAMTVGVHALVNDRIPANCTSTGLVLMAFQTAEYLDAHLPAALAATSDETITDLDALRRELKRTRARGYAINRGGWRMDVGGIAAPVFDADGTIIAGLCIAAPSYRMNKDWFTRLVPATLQAAGAIGDQFGRRASASIQAAS